MQKKMLGNFIFTEKKLIFLQAAFGHGRLGHPQSLEYYITVLVHLILNIFPLANHYNLQETTESNTE